ncbi:UDP-N-acetylenolpyruvoylglucosamine reductase [Jeotgalicoccus coquinae]|uniref:UDP-N-acetylenolpyruvoylglucosamine reductase n=1 Tax=Jeotgalicoccus coquinae TaxID=709509 RepID=A0A6V7RMC7_9STAP|nr:UDP-N-acetylmuramate dehydrogenase [Jeotgalicoccus coquinae]MBB6422270.1 UDP-N-acetylmuramate dehydrogenase [Jeotgalicoccus coquinae]GGE17265.1 UDP-N-acetylenolpyruvoylglucosamine reductase [Jeotgalicoccus coquinae]CAD2079132.1 UDP-N-acetylenolpyruvoylglucosamine reductase [Jeotgalicoccus coquinae]
MNNLPLDQELKKILTSSIVKVDEPLYKYTYTETGGAADIYVEAGSVDDTAAVIRFAKENNLPVTYLGNGSNIIIRDGGIRGIVVSLLNLNKISVDGVTLVAESGAAIIDASQTALQHELSGLEFACGIPGSVGGAVYMNAGAYGGEVKDCLKHVTAINEMGDFVTLTLDELELGYRTSRVQTEHLVVVSAEFELSDNKNHNEIKAVMDDLTEKRESKQPLEYPSCGSVFQRPPGNFAGKLIQDAGLQGHRIGGVEVSKKHAGFMVNVDGGSASDYEDLIHHVQDTIQDEFGVVLHREVRIIGDKLEK